MTFILFIVGLVLSVLVGVGSLLVVKKRASGADGAKLEAMKSEIASLSTKLDTLKSVGGDRVSYAQISGIDEQTKEFVASLEQQKSLLREVETRLDTAQKDVEGKESAQQLLKAASAEDEQRLQTLLAGFGDVSSESISLEQQLALSLKNLDSLMAEATLTADQRAALKELSETMAQAGSRLRDLITDYNAVQERLESLRGQHNDLEDEYTRLVEQQLGA